MTSRRSPNRAIGPTASSSSAAGTSAAAPPATAGVRRNLFHHSLLKRPTASSTTATSTSTLHGDATTQHHHSNGRVGGIGGGGGAGGSGGGGLSAEESTPEFVVRDEHGNYQLEQIIMTPLSREDLQEEGEAEVDNRLIDTYRKHQQHIEPNELKATLAQSLQAKVASLEDDKWMFEVEDPAQVEML